jgi:hypothetical protein
MASDDIKSLKQLVTSISSHHMGADVNTLYHIHDTSQQFGVKEMAESTVLILFIFYYFAQAYLWDVVECCALKRENTESGCSEIPMQHAPPPFET